MPHLLPVSFHSLESSSSLSSTCRRRLSTSQPLSVKRPQKPFPQPIPYIDEHGIFHRPGYNQPIKQVEYLGGLARGGLTLVEKYGSEDGIGLKNAARTDDAAKTEDVGSGKRDWARELGLSLRRKRRMLSSTQFIKESKTVNRSSGGEKPMAYKGGSFGLRPRSRRETAGEGGEESEISQSQRPGIGRGKSINADLHGEAKGEKFCIPEYFGQPVDGFRISCFGAFFSWLGAHQLSHS